MNTPSKTATAKQRLSEIERERTLRQGIESAFEDLELEPLLSKIVANACKLLGAETGGVGLVEEDSRSMVMLAVYNLPTSEIGTKWQPGVGIAGLILTMGRPMIINRYGDIDPQNRPELAEDAVVGVPILRRTKLVGFLGIGARSPHKFTQSDVKILTQYAKACGIAIENAKLLQRTQDSLSQTKLLYATTAALSLAGDISEVVENYLTNVAKPHSMQCNVVIYERDRTGAIMNNVSYGSCDADGTIGNEPSSSSHVPDQLDTLLENGEILVFEDVRTDSRVPKSLLELQIAENNLALVLIPLMSRGVRIGLVTLSHSLPHSWTDNELQPVVITAAHLAATLDTRLEQQHLAEGRASLLLVEERKRLARDLHDSVTQSLFAMQLLSQAIVYETTPEGTDKAKQLAELCRVSLKEMRSLLSELRPLSTGSQQQEREPWRIRKRLESHAKEIGLESELLIEDTDFHGSEPEIEHCAFRIIQEALTNVHKHAKASAVKVLYSTTESGLLIEITDDGIGYSTNTRTPATQFGLVGMKERVKELNGKLEVTTSPGSGVSIRVELPKNL